MLAKDDADQRARYPPSAPFALGNVGVSVSRSGTSPAPTRAHLQSGAVATTVYYCASSLDGYIAEPDDSLEWLLNDQGASEHEAAESDPMRDGGSYERFYERVGALVAGSATYEGSSTTSTLLVGESGLPGETVLGSELTRAAPALGRGGRRADRERSAGEL